MQFVHFSFALGGVIGPFSVEPFLTPTQEKESISNQPRNRTYNTEANKTLVTTPGNKNVTMIDSFINDSTTSVSKLTKSPQTTDVYFAYIISGSLILLVSIPIIYQIFTERSQRKRQNEKDKQEKIKQPLPFKWFILVMSLICLFYALYCAVEDSFASFLTTFVVKQLKWSKSNGAQASSLFWAAFAIGRFSCIFAVRFLSSVKLLLIACSLMAISLTLLTIFSIHNITAGVWLASFLSGAGMAPVFPTAFSWMENELVRVTGLVSAAVLVCSSAGFIINPVVLGYLIEEVSPIWFSYFLCGQSFLLLLVMFLLLGLSRLYLLPLYHMDRTKNESSISI